MKNKWGAAALNIIPGLGYLYVGTRTVFAVLLLSAWPLLVIAIASVPAEELEMMETAEVVPFRIWDLLPFLAISAAFIVDAYQEAVRKNTSQKKAEK